MARWLKDYLHFGSKKSPPQPPKPDYTESEILRAYRAQKNLDFEDPYEEKNNDKGLLGSAARMDDLQLIVSPRHRLIKVEPSEYKRRQNLSLDEEPGGKVGEASDYSNPFDMKNKCIFDHEEMEDTGYMEPYDDHRTPGGDQPDSREKTPEKALQLYDSPYHERYKSLPHDSHPPSVDERPADEYDQPWEWKKDDISRAFAVQFEGSGWQCGSAHIKSQLMPSTPRSPIALRPSSPDHGSPPKELDCSRVRKPICADLQRHGWFHGPLSCTDAEKRLHNSEPGSFLLRTEAETMYFLSVRGRCSILHVKVIVMPDGRFMLGDSGLTFPAIPDMVQHYIQSPLLFPGEGQMCLQHAVSALGH